MFRNLIVCGISLCFGLSYAQAGTIDQISVPDSQRTLDLSLPQSSFSISNSTDYNVIKSPVFLAAADQPTEPAMANMEATPESEYKDRIFTGNKVHKYLGIGSIGAAILTLLAPKEEDSAHEYLAITSAALGLGAVGTGLAYHYEDISMSGGFKDPDNLHALWAGLGAVGIAMAAGTGPDVPHATYGALGAISMMIGIKYTW